MGERERYTHIQQLAELRFRHPNHVHLVAPVLVKIFFAFRSSSADLVAERQ